MRMDSGVARAAGRPEDLHVTLLDVAAVGSQAHRQRIGSGQLGEHGGGCRIGVGGAA